MGRARSVGAQDAAPHSPSPIAHNRSSQHPVPRLTREAQSERRRPALRDLQVVALVALDVGEVVDSHVPLGAAAHRVGEADDPDRLAEPVQRPLATVEPSVNRPEPRIVG